MNTFSEHVSNSDLFSLWSYDMLRCTWSSITLCVSALRNTVASQSKISMRVMSWVMRTSTNRSIRQSSLVFNTVMYHSVNTTLCASYFDYKQAFQTCQFRISNMFRELWHVLVPLRFVSSLRYPFEPFTFKHQLGWLAGLLYFNSSCSNALVVCWLLLST